MTGKIFYKWHHAGLINRIMSLEIAVGLAHCTGKEIILYNGKDHNKSAIDTPSLRGQDNVGRRESIITRDDTSPLDLIDYDSTGIYEIINLLDPKPKEIQLKIITDKGHFFEFYDLYDIGDLKRDILEFKIHGQKKQSTMRDWRRL